jgi:hypothetical protein
MTWNLGVFVSHSWGYSEVYKTLAKWIFAEKWNLSGEPIIFHNHSVPEHDPIHHARNNRELAKALETRIVSSDIMVVPTAMYAVHSDWMQHEIQHARKTGVKILAVNPQSQERKAGDVIENADDLVGWRSESVVKGIWQLVGSQARKG